MYKYPFFNILNFEREYQGEGWILIFNHFLLLELQKTMKYITRDILRYFGMVLNWNSMAWHAISDNLTLKSLLILLWIIAEHKLDFKAHSVWFCTSEPRKTSNILSSSWRISWKLSLMRTVFVWAEMATWVLMMWGLKGSREGNSVDAAVEIATSHSFALSSLNVVAWSKAKAEPPNRQPGWQIHVSQECETAHQHCPPQPFRTVFFTLIVS